jgi:ribonucleoside-diphosphate reductase alpha chain
MMLHFQAWEKGIKSLYYLRLERACSGRVSPAGGGGYYVEAPKYELASSTDYDECLACQ